MTSELLVGWVVCWSWIGFIVGVPIVLKPLSSQVSISNLDEPAIDLVEERKMEVLRVYIP